MGLISKENRPTESRTRTAVRRGTGDCLHYGSAAPRANASWLHYGQKMLKLQTQVTQSAHNTLLRARGRYRKRKKDPGVNKLGGKCTETILAIGGRIMNYFNFLSTHLDFLFHSKCEYYFNRLLTNGVIFNKTYPDKRVPKAYLSS